MERSKPQGNTTYLFSSFIHTPIISESWYLDSSASQHMSSLWILLHDYKELSILKTIILGDNSTYSAFGYGFVLLHLHTSESLLIPDVLHIFV